MAQSIQIKAVNWRHEALADLMITSPHLTLGEIAKELGISMAWLSIVKNSDAFKDYWLIRRRQHADAVTNGIKEKAAALTEMSLDALIQDAQVKMELGILPPEEARANVDLITKRFGFDGMSQPQNGQPQVQLNVSLVSSEALEQARAKMRAIPVEAVPVLEEKK